MCEIQWVNLIKDLRQQLPSSVSFQRLLSDENYRALQMDGLKDSSTESQKSLINRIESLEDVMPYHLQIDYVPYPIKPQTRFQQFSLILFGLLNLILISGAVYAYEHHKTQTKQVLHSHSVQ